MHWLVPETVDNNIQNILKNYSTDSDRSEIVIVDINHQNFRNIKKKKKCALFQWQFFTITTMNEKQGENNSTQHPHLSRINKFIEFCVFRDIFFKRNLTNFLHSVCSNVDES